MIKRFLKSFKRAAAASKQAKPTVAPVLVSRTPQPSGAPSPDDAWLFESPEAAETERRRLVDQMTGLSDMLGSLRTVLADVAADSPSLAEPAALQAGAPVWRDDDLFDGAGGGAPTVISIAPAGTADFLFDEAPRSFARPARSAPDQRAAA